MTTYEELIEAFQIFNRYPDSQDISAQHDIIYAGPDSQNMLPADVARLIELGWHVDNMYDSFAYYT